MACLKKLPCDHWCCGFKDEVECLPCINDKCVELNSQNMHIDQTGSDFCNICYIEGLENAPCI